MLAGVGPIIRAACNEWLNNMKISVIICAYNEEDLIEKSINSILEQDFPKTDYEVIVINDASSDRTHDLAANCFAVCKVKFPELSTCLVDIRHGGLSVARNVGVSLATSDILAFIDADALAKDDWLKQIVRVFDANPDVLICGGWVELLNHESPVARAIHTELIIKREGVPPSLMLMGTNMIFRKQIFERDFGFFEPFTSRGDETVLLEYLGVGHVAPVSVPVAGGRMILDDAIVVYHERPSSYLAWLQERYHNGRFYILAVKIVSLLKHMPSHYNQWRILLNCARGILGSIVIFPFRVYKFSRKIPWADSVKLHLVKFAGSLCETVGVLKFMSLYRDFILTDGINSISRSRNFIEKVQRIF